MNRRAFIGGVVATVIAGPLAEKRVEAAVPSKPDVVSDASLMSMNGLQYLTLTFAGGDHGLVIAADELMASRVGELIGMDWNAVSSWLSAFRGQIDPHLHL